MLASQRIADTIAENRTAESGKLKYCVDGIGGSADCHLQVVINTTSFNAIQDIDYLKDTPYTTVKLQFSKVRSVSEAVSLVKKSKLCSLKVIVGSNDDNAVEETLETFAVDFAVGIGAGQFLGGGINSAEFYTKYNRLQEISAENPKIPFAGSKFVC